MNLLSAMLQESEHRTTIHCSLREQMEASSEELARNNNRRRGIKERSLGVFKGISCCGVGTRLRGTTLPHEIEEEERERPDDNETVTDPDSNRSSDPEPSMNLAAALAAERQLRSGGDSNPMGTPARVSLMRLLEDSEEDASGGGGLCCVCMGRKKGAAFIPCGHTFCRVCSRQLWLNRGSCPLCNRPILEILDIF